MLKVELAIIFYTLKTRVILKNPKNKKILLICTNICIPKQDNISRKNLLDPRYFFLICDESNVSYPLFVNVLVKNIKMMSMTKSKSNIS